MNREVFCVRGQTSSVVEPFEIKAVELPGISTVQPRIGCGIPVVPNLFEQKDGAYDR